MDERKKYDFPCPEIKADCDFSFDNSWLPLNWRGCFQFLKKTDVVFVVIGVNVVVDKGAMLGSQSLWVGVWSRDEGP